MDDHTTIPEERDFPFAHLELRAQHLVSEVTARNRRRRRTLMLVPAVAVLLLAATGFTTYVLTKSEPTHLDTIGCYDRADLEANVAVVGSGTGDPVSRCRAVWDGAFPTAVPDSLAACVLQSGAIGVFPSARAGMCARLGLAPLSSAGLAESRRFAALRDAIIARVGEPASGSTRGTGICVGEREARAIVREELVKHGYGSFRIQVGGGTFSDQRPCADVSLDSESQTVILIPMGRD